MRSSVHWAYLFCKAKPIRIVIGNFKVKEASELQNAIEIAFKEDDEILIESFLNGTEVSVGVLDYKGETIVLGITEIVPKNEFSITKQSTTVPQKKLLPQD